MAAAGESDGITIDLNADMGESFGRWVLGNDKALMPYLTSASIACGFHAGDPHVMRENASLAVAHGVGIGAHVGLPDLVGFGRRRMAITPSQLYDYVLYQAGALKAFVETAGGRLQHIKPHSILYVMIQEDSELAAATAEAVAALGDDVLLFLTGETAKTAAARAGVGFVSEGFVDMGYAADGSLVLAITSRDPAVIAERAFRLAVESKTRTTDGEDLDVQADSICIHGDVSNASDIAAAIRRRLESAGIELRRPQPSQVSRA
jgi:UPF0271 protein